MYSCLILQSHIVEYGNNSGKLFNYTELMYSIVQAFLSLQS